MNFNTLEFLFLFLPPVVAVYHLVPGRWRLPVVLAASLFFYGASGIVPMVFMVISIAWGFATAFVLGRYPGWPGRLLAVSFPLLVLYVFKYLGFTLDSLGAGPETRDALTIFLAITLPAGISFYTFQIVSYSIDVADGTVEVERSPIRFATYIALFPQLIAGPIVRYGQMQDQLARVSTQRWLKTDWRSGLKLLSIGLFGKVFFADILNLFHKNIFAIDFMADATPLDALYLCLAYSFQIYYDFWAYSLMAIGLGKLLAIDLPVNFREPYLSANPREFWRRWHITLSYWLRDYVYIKIGGNRAYVRNIVILFALVGLWHGAGWNFVVWGLYHALLVVGYHGSRRWWDRMPQALQVGTTFTLVTFGWPLFFADLGEYRLILEKMIGLHGAGEGIYGLRHWLVLAAIAAWTFSMREARWLYNDRPRAVFDWPVAHAAALFLGAIFVYFSGTFIYFRF